MIKAIAHICISTTDLDKTETFYCGALGLSKKFNFIREGKVFGYYLRINEHNYIEVFLSHAITPEEQPAIKHFCLEVEDMDNAIRRIRSAGVTVTDKKMGHDQSWQAWLADPNGITIELHEYTDKSSQVLGSDCFL